MLVRSNGDVTGTKLQKRVLTRQKKKKNTNSTSKLSLNKVCLCVCVLMYVCICVTLSKCIPVVLPVKYSLHEAMGGEKLMFLLREVKSLAA